MARRLHQVQQRLVGWLQSRRDCNHRRDGPEANWSSSFENVGRPLPFQSRVKGIVHDDSAPPDHRYEQLQHPRMLSRRSRLRATRASIQTAPLLQALRRLSNSLIFKFKGFCLFFGGGLYNYLNEENSRTSREKGAEAALQQEDLPTQVGKSADQEEGRLVLSDFLHARL